MGQRFALTECVHTGNDGKKCEGVVAYVLWNFPPL